MDILYQLPFPDEVCSKILLFACKNPHTGLGVEVLKNKLKPGVSGDMNDLDITDKDEDVTCIDTDEMIYYPYNMSIELFYYTCFTNLTLLNLCDTRAMGDIVCLKSMMKLRYLDIGDTGVTGNIMHLDSLLELAVIYLQRTDVMGDINHFKSLLNLTDFNICRTGVTGDIVDLKMLPNLTEIGILNTGVTGNEELFQEYRKSVGLKRCEIWRD